MIPEGLSFPTHARKVARAIQSSFSDIVVEGGADPLEYQSIRRVFGINKNLAWKLSKLIQADNPSGAFSQMPGAGGIRIFLDAAERAGAKRSRLEAALDAVGAYRELIRIHCGDRATFEIMCSEFGAEGAAAPDEHHRKQYFQGGSAIWGVQCRTNHKLGIIAPSSEGGSLDFASVNSLIGFRRIRPAVTWVMASRFGKSDDGTRLPAGAPEALDPRYESPDVAPLLGDFCSQPPPELRRISIPGGSKFRLVEGPVGATAELTCTLGTIWRGIPYRRTESNQWGEHSALSHIPARHLLVDLFVHESLEFAMSPEVAFHGDLGEAACESRAGTPTLQIQEALQDLGVSRSPPPTPESPQYARLLRDVYRRTGWDPGAFHGFRVSLAYPPFPGRVTLRYPLPEGSGG